VISNPIALLYVQTNSHARPLWDKAERILAEARAGVPRYVSQRNQVTDELEDVSFCEQCGGYHAESREVCA
jgi:hypothetical protein